MGNNFSTSVQFAFSGQKGWRFLWKQGRNKPTSDDHSIKGQKAMLKECFWATVKQKPGCVEFKQKFSQKTLSTAEEYCNQ